MNELGLDVLVIREWFPHEQDSPYVLIKVKEAHVSSWGTSIGLAVRRCYITDDRLARRASDTGQSQSVIVAAVLPDPGAVMSGDFGEILGYLYQAAIVYPGQAFGPKKWRLKQDRNKPAPHSDLVQFLLPEWPRATSQDCILCAEVKAKSTPGASTPIASALADCKKDRISRLGRTLVWLKERALLEDLRSVEIAQLDRFIHATEHPPALKLFRAIAVVSEALAEAELQAVPQAIPAECTLIVMVVPDLYQTYSAVFAAAKEALVIASATPPGQAP